MTEPNPYEAALASIRWFEAVDDTQLTPDYLRKILLELGFTHPVEVACRCGLEPPTTFPRMPVSGDYCPIGPLHLHHWHGDVCVFCSGTR
jgi:hypothetical protein